MRYHSTDGGMTAATQTLVKDFFGEPTEHSHQISNTTIGPDGKLYVHKGDGFDFTTALNLNSYRGKILRMNFDGTAPTDNPLYNASDGINARDFVFTYGMRNPVRRRLAGCRRLPLRGRQRPEHRPVRQGARGPQLRLGRRRRDDAQLRAVELGAGERAGEPRVRPARDAVRQRLPGREDDPRLRHRVGSDVCHRAADPRQADRRLPSRVGELLRHRAAEPDRVHGQREGDRQRPRRRPGRPVLHRPLQGRGSIVTDRPGRQRPPHPVDGPADRLRRGRRAPRPCGCRWCRPTSSAAPATARTARRSRSRPATRPSRARASSRWARRTRTGSPSTRPAPCALDAIVGNPGTSADEADVRVTVNITDVRRTSDLGRLHRRARGRPAAADHRPVERAHAGGRGHGVGYAAGVHGAVRRDPGRRPSAPPARSSPPPTRCRRGRCSKAGERSGSSARSWSTTAGPTAPRRPPRTRRSRGRACWFP